MAGTPHFRKFVIISLMVHIVLLLFSQFNSLEPKQEKMLIEFKINRLKKLGSTKNRGKVKDLKFNRLKKPPKKPVDPKKKNPPPRLVENSFSSRSGNKKTSQAEPILTRPLTLGKSDYPVKTFSANQVEDHLKKIDHEQSDFFNITTKKKERNPFDQVKLKQNPQRSSPNRETTQFKNPTTTQNSSGGSSSPGRFSWQGKGKRELISRGNLKMPESLRNKGIKTVVIIFFQVDRLGRPMGTELLKSSGYTELDNEVKRYTRTFRFNRVDDSAKYQAELTQIFQP